MEFQNYPSVAGWLVCKRDISGIAKYKHGSVQPAEMRRTDEGPNYCVEEAALRRDKIHPDAAPHDLFNRPGSPAMDLPIAFAGAVKRLIWLSKPGVGKRSSASLYGKPARGPLLNSIQSGSVSMGMSSAAPMILAVSCARTSVLAMITCH